MGRSGRLEEPDGKITGQGASVSRAGDQAGPLIAFRLPPARDRAAAEAFLRQAMRPQGSPEKIALEQRGSTTAALRPSNQTHTTALVLRHSQSLKNLVAPAPRAGKRRPRPLRGVNSVWTARGPLAGIEVRQAMRKGQVLTQQNTPALPAAQFSALAA